MKTNKNFLKASTVLLVASFWCVPAHSESGLPAFFGRASCAENMSCIPNSRPMSLIVADAVNMSQAGPSGASTLSACVSEFNSMHIAAAIETCEGFLNHATGSVHDRAMAMYFLGLAYSRSREAFSKSGKVADTKAFKLWSKAAEVDPTYIEPHLAIGYMFGWFGENELAQRAFDRAEMIDPNDWRVYTGRATAFASSHTIIKHTTLALAAAEKAAAIEPDEPHVRMTYGRMLQINERYADAAKQYEAAIGKYDPVRDTTFEFISEPYPLQALAYVYNRMGKPAAAAETLTKYIDSTPAANRDFSLYQERAEYFELAGNYEKAAADFKEAARLAPPEFAEDLAAKSAMLLARAGAKSMAGEELRSVLKRGSLRPTLKIQVFLRNQGYGDVTINGKYDGPTSRALEECLKDKSCAPIIGQAI